ncbi:unnamed protein product [Bursaphelenchus okinawaensis]|uniref:Protein kinase domain-containing protein n=1 Tax=Bursaphelenchus okinawaensis TaxID=465554 RepID=A0A811K708_9BILA|nr:unnamed protein product [Bursaphelenchus okinawaensis]CAG9092744.1 unnamed protein product [Bursaphelenchus okinawaensis]
MFVDMAQVAPQLAPVSKQQPPSIQNSETSERLPQVGEFIVGDKTKRKFRIVSVLGDGGYGTVYEATDEIRKVAIKTEKYTKSMLHIEINVLRSANTEHCKHILELIDHGVSRPNFAYVIMPLLGKDIHRLRNEQKERKFSLGTAIRVGIQGLKSIQELHEKCGFLSRDVKPGNFACGHPNSIECRTIFLIDFGLARKYIDKNKNVLPSRKEVGWRGTTRYGSLQAHQKQDLGRKDDLESWFYMLVEITKGHLPWRAMTDRDQVYAAKLSSRTLNRQNFLSECPDEFCRILSHIDMIKFAEAPAYGEILAFLNSIMARLHVMPDTPFDWEDDSSNMSSTKNSSYSDNEQRCNRNDRLSRENALHY